MKYFKAFSNNLPNTIAQKAIFNSDRNFTITDEFSMGCILSKAFTWAESKEGLEYWHKIYDSYKDVILYKKRSIVL